MVDVSELSGSSILGLPRLSKEICSLPELMWERNSCTRIRTLDPVTTGATFAVVL